MTETAGAPSGGPGVPGPPGPGASAAGGGPARRRRQRLRRGSALAVTVVVAGTAGAGWALYAKLSGNITPDEAAAAELARYERERPTALVRDARNILLIGSDARSGDGNASRGRGPGAERSDATVLLHLSAGRRSATAVSVPRDLMVDVPGCRRRDGTRAEPVFTMFNHAFRTGGSACTVRTVEKLTGIRVDHYVVVDFHGFKELVDAVGGVEMCLKEPIDDKAAGLRLPAGRVRLDGERALGYVRARKSLGNGSDTARMERQQRFLGALVDTVRDDGVLLNPVKLYPVLDAATSALTTDPALASLRGLYELVRGLREIPAERVQFLTVPRESYVHDPQRDQLVKPEAEKLFERLRRDEPVVVAHRPPGDSAGKSRAGAGDTAAGPRGNAPGQPYRPSRQEPGGYGAYVRGDGTSGRNPGGKPPGGPAAASPAPTFRGNTAAEDTCA
ncbi:LCP family protein [Streptomyces glaucus]|uniref:LCP family protein n=1 Tax=Streptomyces glaucus TaxID=284029 RepID=A0ABN3K7L9_9ACTN